MNACDAHVHQSHTLQNGLHIHIYMKENNKTIMNAIKMALNVLRYILVVETNSAKLGRNQ